MKAITTIITLLLLCCGIGTFGQTAPSFFYNGDGAHQYYDLVHPRGNDTVYVESFTQAGVLLEKGIYTQYHTDYKARHGEHTYYYSGTTAVREVSYYQGNRVLSRTTYYIDGAVKRSEQFDADGKLLDGHCYQPDGTEREFTPFEARPSYLGGEQKMLENLYRNIKYPMWARENGIRGTVVAVFMVETDGSISNCRIVRGIGGGCDEEVLRVIRMLGPFIPGTQDGEPARLKYYIPVKFSSGCG